MNETLRMPIQNSDRETVAWLVERRETALPADLKGKLKWLVKGIDKKSTPLLRLLCGLADPELQISWGSAPACRFCRTNGNFEFAEQRRGKETGRWRHIDSSVARHSAGADETLAVTAVATAWPFWPPRLS